MLWTIYLLLFGLCVTGTHQEKIEAESVNDPLDKIQRHLPDVELDWSSQHDIETINLKISVPAGHALVATLDKKFDLRPLRTNSYRFFGNQKEAKEYVMKIEHAGPELSDATSNHVSRVPDGYFVVRRPENGIIITYVSEEQQEPIARWLISTITVEDAISVIPELEDESSVSGIIRVTGFKQILNSPFEKLPGVGK